MKQGHSKNVFEHKFHILCRCVLHRSVPALYVLARDTAGFFFLVYRSGLYGMHTVASQYVCFL